MSKRNTYQDIDIKERIDLELRSLYSEYGYNRFKMGKFEDYDLYTKFRDFIPNENIITVTGQNGRLLALRPDLTLSIVKYFRPEEKDVEKLYYSENIYRSDRDGDYQELRQTGLEFLGNIGSKEISEVAILAALSLKNISNDFVLDISHMGFLQEIMVRIPEKAKKPILKAISEKSPSSIKAIAKSYEIPDSEILVIEQLTSIYGDYKTTIPRLKELPLTKRALEYLSEIENVSKTLSARRVGGTINIDFSIVNNMSYYSGILLQGYIKGLPEKILSGGQYDGVMANMGKGGSAIGFALYLDFLDKLESESGEAQKGKNAADDYINVALPKGRLGDKIYDLFEKAGYPCKDIKGDNRKLVFENKSKKIRYFLVKPSDVTVYVERGTADIGACGNDIIEEYSPDVYELLDLKKGKCKVAVAAKEGFKDDTSKTLRVATKFPEITRRYYDRESRKIDIIELHGSIELAPVLDMSDVIVDIVETGKTLKENNLAVIDDVLDVSARLIANKSSFKFKNNGIVELTEKLDAIIK